MPIPILQGIKKRVKRDINRTANVLSAPSRLKTKVKGKVGEQRIIEKRAEANVRKKYGGGGIGTQEMAQLKLTEVRRLKKVLKNKFK